MKLAVNKEHKSGIFEKKLYNTYLKGVSLFIATATFSGLLTSAALYASDLETIMPINQNVRASVYYNNDYLKETFNLTEEEVFNRVNSESDIDEYMTDKTFQNITYLNIDRQKMENLSFLQYFPNLQEINIRNAILILNEDIAYLNDSQLNNITLQLSVQDIIKLNSNGTGLNSLAKEFITINIHGEIEDELDELIIYNFIKSNPNARCDAIDLAKCKTLNDNLDILYNSIDFSTCKNESDKTFKIIEFMLNYLEYDESLEQYQEEHDSFDLNSFEYQELLYYNNELLSSVLKPQKESTEAVCCNFSALFSILCYKANIENYYVKGIYNNPSIPHTWNILRVDDEYKLVDLVKQDAFYLSYAEYKDYELNQTPETLNNLKEKLTSTLDENILSEYIAYEDVEKLLSTIEEIDYPECNLAKSGDLINNQGIDIKWPIIIGLTSGIIAVVIPSARKRSRR